MIPMEYHDVYSEHVRLYHELPVTDDTALELLRGYKQYIVQRVMLEQMAQGSRSNADFAKWAEALIRNEPKHPIHRRGLGGKRVKITAA